MSYVRFALFCALISPSLNADPVVIGSSSFGCETEVLSQQPIQFQPSAHENILPAKCEDFSGQWEGGCYGALMKCPRVTELGDCIMPRPDEVYLDNVWVPGQDVTDPPADKPSHVITITQSGCASLGIEGPEGTFFAGKRNLDFTHDQSGAGSIRFRRTCEISTPRPARWRRTFEMGLGSKSERMWNHEGTRAHVSNDLSGRDTNYGATYRKVGKYRFYHPKADKDRLRVDYGYWIGNRNYDPPALEFFSPDFGGTICVWKRSIK